MSVFSPFNEEARLKEVETLNLRNLLTPGELDEYARNAAEVCGTPVSLVTVVEKTEQWFAGKCGVDMEGTPREISFCNYTIQQFEAFIVEDMTKNELFKNNPLVTDDPKVRFYAGFPLTTRNGFNIGSLCVVDLKPNSLNEEQKKLMHRMAQEVIKVIELRHQAITLEAQLGARKWLSNLLEGLHDINCRSFNSQSEKKETVLKAATVSFNMEAAAWICPEGEGFSISSTYDDSEFFGETKLDKFKSLVSSAQGQALFNQNNSADWRKGLEEIFDCALSSFVLAPAVRDEKLVGWLLLASDGFDTHTRSVIEEKAIKILAENLVNIEIQAIQSQPKLKIAS